MNRSFVAVAQVLVLLAVGVPSTNAGESSTGDLAALNRFVGTRSGATTLHLDEPVEVPTISFGQDPVRIRSTGRIAGLVMKQDVPKGGVELISLSVGLCPKTPCKEKRISFTTVWEPSQRGFPRETTLPAGDYFVRFIADGPTEIDLRLSGLEGTARFPLSRTDEVHVVEPKTTFDPLPSHNVYSAEAEHELAGIGWGIIAVELEAEKMLYGDIDTCLQEEPIDPVRSQLSGPIFFSSCDGSGAGTSVIRQPIGRNREVIISLGTLDKGHYFHGVAYKSVAESHQMSAIAVDVGFPRGKRSGGMGAGLFYSDEG